MSGLETPLINEHRKAGAKIVEFGGWQMPVSYSSVLKEHEAVREKCGMFDVSHMGEIFIEGKEAEEFCQYLTINDVSKLKTGGGQYSALLNENGGIIDDLIIYRLSDQQFLLCVNASNVQMDFQWIQKNASRYPKASVRNASTEYGQIALQGPESVMALAGLVEGGEKEKVENLPYTHIVKLKFETEEILVARTGYTGEKGFEIYASPQCTQKIWQRLMEADSEVIPCGLGCRDTLRLEACYLLYGQDMNDEVNPYEAGISWALKMDKPDFIGKSALNAQKTAGIRRKIIAFKLEDKGIARQGMPVLRGDRKIGEVTSGSFLPTLKFAGGMALCEVDDATEGSEISIDIRGKAKKAFIVKKPLYSARVR